MPTNWWGRQNAAPLKFDPKQDPPKLPPSNYDHTVADGATHGIDTRCEVIVVANAQKIQSTHIKVFWL